VPKPVAKKSLTNLLGMIKRSVVDLVVVPGPFAAG